MTFPFVSEWFGSPTAAAAKARAAAAQGRYREALALAPRADRRTPELEREVVGWRRRAYAPGAPAAAWPPASPDPFPGAMGVPEIPARALTAAVLGGAIQNHGCVLVRGLAGERDVAALADAVERAFAAAAAYEAGAPEAQTLPWYAPFPLDEGGELTATGRAFTLAGGGVWTPDSPRALELLIGVLRRKGVVSAIADYLGEEPYLSLAKSTLRKVPVTTGTGWHQDGAFLGRDIRTVNCWLALTDCGVDAPGLDLYPKRVDLFPTGTAGADFGWSVSDAIVADLAKETPVASPVFAAGDALLFDHLFLHRTGVRPGMTRERLAIESWFFAGSSFPMKQIPLAI